MLTIPDSSAAANTIIYGMNAYSREDVIEINLTTNSSQWADDSLFDTQAIAQDPVTGRVYYFEWQDSGNELAYWDPATGTNTHVETYYLALWGLAMLDYLL